MEHNGTERRKDKLSVMERSRRRLKSNLKARKRTSKDDNRSQNRMGVAKDFFSMICGRWNITK